MGEDKDDLPSKRDKVRFQSLIMEFEDIIGRLEDALPHDQEGYRRRLLELINRISKYITRNKRSLKKGLGDIMGGRVLELETDKIMAEAEARGKKLGLNEKEYICFKNCMDRCMTFEDARALSGSSDDAAEEHYQRWLKEQKNK